MANEKQKEVENVQAVSPAVAEVNRLVENGLKALDEFMLLDQDQVDYILSLIHIFWRKRSWKVWN